MQERARKFRIGMLFKLQYGQVFPTIKDDKREYKTGEVVKMVNNPFPICKNKISMLHGKCWSHRTG